MGGGWPLQDWASGSAPGHLAGRVAAGTWCVVLSFTLKETGLCPTPRPGPGKQTVTGEKEAVVQGLIQILEAVGSKASPACSLSGLLTCYCPGPRASSSGPFCSSNTHSHVHIRALYYRLLYLGYVFPRRSQGRTALPCTPQLKATSSERLP